MVAIDILRAILTPAWRLFTDTPVPGLSSELVTVSFADLLIGIILIRFSIGLLNSGLGLGVLYRSKDSKNAKVSEARKGDEK